MENLNEAKTEDLIDEAKRLYDIIHNVGMYDAVDELELESLCGEIERRGYGKHEMYSIDFIAIEMGMN